MSNDYSEISNNYELRKVAEGIYECLFDETLSKSERIKKLSVLFEEYQNITEISDDELKQQVMELYSISEKDILEMIDEKIKNYEQ